MASCSKFSLSEKALTVLAVLAFIGPIVYSYATQEERICLNSMRDRFANDVKVKGDYEWLEKTYNECLTKNKGNNNG